MICPSCGTSNAVGVNFCFERMSARAFVGQVDALLARAQPDPDRRAARPSDAGLVGWA